MEILKQQKNPKQNSFPILQNIYKKERLRVTSKIAYNLQIYPKFKAYS